LLDAADASYDCDAMTLSNELVSKLRELPREDRAELARQLIASLDPEPPDPDAEATWAAEIDRRLDSVDESTLVDWRESVRRAREALRKMDKQ
jgi:putative addiction module component (TIGR02574 family)